MCINVCLLLLVTLFSYVIIDGLPYKRYRRQAGYFGKEDLPYGGWGGGSSNPSGAIPGAYYGTGINPNYGDFGPNKNDADSSIHVLNYNQGYSPNSGLVPHWYQNQQQSYASNNNQNNAWQRPYSNYNQIRPYNRYPPGSQGWYATGGNHWYNNAQSTISCTGLLMTSILISIVRI